MQKTIVIIIICLTFQVAKAQITNISHAKLTDISLEEPVLLDIIGKSSISYDDVLDAALLIGGHSNEMERIRLKKGLNSFIDSELKAIYNSRKLEKSLIKIESKIKAKYIKVFVQNALLKDAIAVGEYNCVQFATLYAYVLDRLEIPFYVKADGRCYYVFTAPQDRLITVNEMQPLEISTDPAYHEQFAQMLAGMKIISDIDLVTRNHSEIYKEYKDEPDKMTPKMLLATQFVLHSSLESLVGSYETSFEYAKAADFLLPSIATLSYTLSSGYTALDNQDYSDNKVITLISNLYAYNETLFDVNYLVQAVVNLEENLTRNNYKQAINELLSLELRDSALAKVYYAFHDIESVFFFEQAKLDSGYYHATRAYKYSNRDEESKVLFVNRFLAAYDQKPTDEAQLELNRLFLSYPELKENQFFQIIKLNMTLINASEFIAVKNWNAALSLLTKFEIGYKKITSDLKPEEGNILATYGALATHYFSKNRITQAKIMIDKALEFYPYNNLLLFKKNAIYGN